MRATAKVLPMHVPIGKRKPYLIDWRKTPKQHPEVEISVCLQDSVHWYCDKKFRVLKVGRHEEDPHAPLPLFYRRFPKDNPEFGFQVNSGPARPEAIGHTYKAHFEFADGTKLDPHIRVTP
jgi:hypothetical protein